MNGGLEACPFQTFDFPYFGYGNRPLFSTTA